MAPASAGPGSFTIAVKVIGDRHDRAACEVDDGNMARSHPPWWVVLRTALLKRVVTRVFKIWPRPAVTFHQRLKNHDFGTFLEFFSDRDLDFFFFPA